MAFDGASREPGRRLLEQPALADVLQLSRCVEPLARGFGGVAPERQRLDLRLRCAGGYAGIADFIHQLDLPRVRELDVGGELVKVEASLFGAQRGLVEPVGDLGEIAPQLGGLGMQFGAPVERRHQRGEAVRTFGLQALHRRGQFVTLRLASRLEYLTSLRAPRRRLCKPLTFRFVLTALGMAVGKTLRSVLGARPGEVRRDFGGERGDLVFERRDVGLDAVDGALLADHRLTRHGRALPDRARILGLSQRGVGTLADAEHRPRPIRHARGESLGSPRSFGFRLGHVAIRALALQLEFARRARRGLQRFQPRPRLDQQRVNPRAGGHDHAELGGKMERGGAGAFDPPREGSEFSPARADFIAASEQRRRLAPPARHVLQRRAPPRRGPKRLGLFDTRTMGGARGLGFAMGAFRVPPPHFDILTRRLKSGRAFAARQQIFREHIGSEA